MLTSWTLQNGYESSLFFHIPVENSIDGILIRKKDGKLKILTPARTILKSTSLTMMNYRDIQRVIVKELPYENAESLFLKDQYLLVAASKSYT